MLIKKILRLFRKPEPAVKKSYDIPPFLRSTPSTDLPTATDVKKVPDKLYISMNLGEKGHIHVYQREDGSTYSSKFGSHKR
jgi:hypothetical protein